MTTAACESCGMPIESGRYCGYCTDETGALQPFEERFDAGQHASIVTRQVARQMRQVSAEKALPVFFGGE